MRPLNSSACWITGAESPGLYSVRYTLMCEQRTHSHTIKCLFVNCLLLLPRDWLRARRRLLLLFSRVAAKGEISVIK